MATGSATHNLTFSYDVFGNMTCVVNAQTQGLCPSYTLNTATNRMANTGYTYDAAGDLTADGTGTGTHTYQWDAENRMTSIDTGTTASYTYNALGQRVEKNASSVYTEYVFDTSGEPVGENNRTHWTLSLAESSALDANVSISKTQLNTRTGAHQPKSRLAEDHWRTGS